jgi:hypothetical protein
MNFNNEGASGRSWIVQRYDIGTTGVEFRTNITSPETTTRAINEVRISYFFLSIASSVSFDLIFSSNAQAKSATRKSALICPEGGQRQ